MGFKSGGNIDAIFIIDGEYVDNDGEWKGLTQTMNRNFKQQIAIVNDQTKQQIALVNDKVELVEKKISKDIKLVNEKVELVKEGQQEMKLAQEATKAQLD